jgi:hypothetical protein
LEGAKKLLKNAKPFNYPVDVYVMHQHDNKNIEALCATPRLCYVVKVKSDTSGIV